MTDDATLTYMKAGYLEGDNPSRDDAIELIDEIKRLRAENQEIRKWLECSRMLNGELQSELDRYKTPNVDNCACHETSTRNCSVHQNDGGAR